MTPDPNNFWEQLERLEKLIKSSELKAGVIFSFHSLVLGLFVERLESFQILFRESVIFIFLGSLWILCVMISIYFCFRCFMPRLETKYDKNVFFFKDTVHAFGNIQDYSKKVIDVCKDEEELFRHLSEQIHVESKIIDKKFDSVHKSIKFFALSFVFIVLTLIFWLIML